MCGVLEAALRVESVGRDGCRMGATGATVGKRVVRRERRGAKGCEGERRGAKGSEGERRGEKGSEGEDGTCEC